MRNYFSGALLVVISFMVFFLPILLMDNASLAPLRVLSPKPVWIVRQNGTKNISVDYLKYLQMKTEIQQKLIFLTGPAYKDPRSFISYGDPVSKFLPPVPNKVKRILDYTGFFGEAKFIPKDITCSENVICKGTNNKSDLLSSDAVVFHARDFRGLPKQRLPHQRWVFFVMESPYHMGLRPSEFNGVFNYTSTYRRDSDAQVTYFTSHRRPTNLTNPEFHQIFSNIMRTKTRLVAQMNSNCGAPHTNRLSYIRELKTHMPVDTYGACGTLKCPRGTKECDDTMKSYKFYMAMENSHCRDYITEKVGRPLLEWGSVPVVMGGAGPKDYEHLLPPGSFIHTSAFETPQKLAEYLLLLDRNPDLLQPYHDWRRTFTGQVYEFDVWCKLCRKLYNTSAPVQTYRDFSGWYAQDTCKI